MTWSFYADAGLTVDFVGVVPFNQVQSGGSVDKQIYFGNPEAGATLQAASDPGNDPITLTPHDTAGGSGVETSMIKLASSAVGLDSATAGAALSVGNTLSSGVDNAVAVHVRLAAGALSNGTYTDAGIEVVATVET